MKWPESKKQLLKIGLPCSTAAVIFGIFLYKWLGTYSEFWITYYDPQTQKNIQTHDTLEIYSERHKNLAFTEFKDDRRNWDGSLVYRTVWKYGKDHTVSSWSHGPMTATNKLHGEWKTVFFDHLDANDLYPDKKQWFWYGDEVSEGKWHELNR